MSESRREFMVALPFAPPPLYAECRQAVPQGASQRAGNRDGGPSWALQCYDVGRPESHSHFTVMPMSALHFPHVPIAQLTPKLQTTPTATKHQHSRYDLVTVPFCGNCTSTSPWKGSS